MSRICIATTATLVTGLALFAAVQATDDDRTVSAHVAIHDYHLFPNAVDKTRSLIAVSAPAAG